MIAKKNFLSDRDLLAWDIMQRASAISQCADKQVVAVGFYPGGIHIGYNTPLKNICDGKCNHCGKCATHAEVNLLDNGKVYEAIYVNLFPCESCQRALEAYGVVNVYVFGGQHKQDIDAINITLLPILEEVLYAFNGDMKQKVVAIGELAELTCELTNSLRKDTRPSDIPTEIIDVDLQTSILKHNTIFSDYQKQRTEKYNKLLSKFSTL